MMFTVPKSIRSRRLCAGLAATLALPPSLALCTTRVVSSCADDGSVGTLRHQVGIAASGDTIDLSTSQLTCSTITLDAGAVAISQTNLTLVGPTDRAVTIATPSGVLDRVLNHTAGLTGNLYVSGLTLSGGNFYSYDNDAKGGCIFSGGAVHLQQTVVTGCKATTIHGVAAGGGVYAQNRISLDRSIVQGNIAYATFHDARGGGVTGDLYLSSSTLSGNSAVSGGLAGGHGLGGGVYIQGSLNGGGISMEHSTIDSNHADQGGGVFQRGRRRLGIVDSSISGNTATIRGGGIDSRTYYSGVYNSTVAFNSAPNYAGIYLDLSFTSYPFQASSSIIARNVNTSPGGFADVYLKNQGFDPNFHNNLIISYNIVPPVGVIVSTADPQLAPLAWHGGPTRTHALLAASPAIDAGDNPKSLPEDQRGPGFARVVNGTADIGAYERQVNDDEILFSGFD